MQNLRTISDNIHLPKKEGDVGYNLVANEDTWIKKDEVSFIKTGVKVKLPDGYWAILTARSSAVFRRKVLILSGIIDNGFVGELIIPAIALERQQLVIKGESVAQLILFPMVTPHLELVTELPQTDRGENGFGHTGS